MDEFLLANKGAEKKLLESHPELAFAWLNGGRKKYLPLENSKRRKAGRDERINLLLQAHPQAKSPLDEARKKQFSRNKVQIDDLLDALALAIMAHLCKKLFPLPKDLQKDANDLPKAIWIPRTKVQTH